MAGSTGNVNRGERAHEGFRPTNAIQRDLNRRMERRRLDAPAGAGDTDMSIRAARWTAGAIWAATIVFAVLAAILLAQSYSTASLINLRGLRAIFGVETATVGLIIVWRRPENPIGWLFCSLGIINGIEAFAEEYAIYALLTQPGTLPLGAVAGWIRQWIWVVAITHGPFLFLLFPDGRYLSRRWRIAGWWALAGCALATLARAFQSGDLILYPPFQNPAGLVGIAGLLTSAGVLGSILLLTGALASLVSLVTRLRRARGLERLQLWWFSLPGIPIYIYLSLALYRAVFDVDLESVMRPLYIVTLLIFPAASIISFLKYHLYDVGLLINRTIVYGPVTAILGGIYFGSVVLLQQFLRPVTQGSDIAIAASTLLAAALFQPLRKRVQQTVDQVFYRQRYDTAQTIDTFSRRLREQIDLDVLSRELQEVVVETMRPASVSLWLRPPEALSRRQRGR